MTVSLRAGNSSAMAAVTVHPSSFCLTSKITFTLVNTSGTFLVISRCSFTDHCEPLKWLVNIPYLLFKCMSKNIHRGDDNNQLLFVRGYEHCVRGYDLCHSLARLLRWEVTTKLPVTKAPCSRRLSTCLHTTCTHAHWLHKRKTIMSVDKSLKPTAREADVFCNESGPPVIDFVSYYITSHWTGVWSQNWIHWSVVLTNDILSSMAPFPRRSGLSIVPPKYQLRLDKTSDSSCLCFNSGL